MADYTINWEDFDYDQPCQCSCWAVIEPARFDVDITDEGRFEGVYVGSGHKFVALVYSDLNI